MEKKLVEKKGQKTFVKITGEGRWVTISGEGKPNKRGTQMFFKANVHPTKEDYEALQVQLKEALPEVKVFSPTFKQDKKDKSLYIPTKTQTTHKDGNPTVIKVYDASGKDITSRWHESGKLIGNGSKIKVFGTVHVSETDDGDKQASVFLNSIQIIDLKEYVSQVEAEEGTFSLEDSSDDKIMDEMGVKSEAKGDDLFE